MSSGQELAAYRQLEVQTASPMELVIVLCDTLIRDMKAAISAILSGSVEERVKHSNHAFAVIQELECMLNFEDGGETAKELSRVYGHVRAKLLETQFKLSTRTLESQIELMEQLRDAWKKALAGLTHADLQQTKVPVPDFAQIPAGPYHAGEEIQSCSWSA